ncbi:MAG: hypothetical protein NZM37_06545, partial [Sandaracinaceae bacterium]|nr:hypothetical protein [Sandaracinaceae bacterium]
MRFLLLPFLGIVLLLPACLSAFERNLNSAMEDHFRPLRRGGEGVVLHRRVSHESLWNAGGQLLIQHYESLVEADPSTGRIVSQWQYTKPRLTIDGFAVVQRRYRAILTVPPGASRPEQVRIQLEIQERRRGTQ